jgi:hypothetical protein
VRITTILITAAGARTSRLITASAAVAIRICRSITARGARRLSILITAVGARRKSRLTTAAAADPDPIPNPWSKKS